MASGLSTCHPKTAADLRALGITEDQVIQTWGYADASAGYHAPEGYYALANGAGHRPFSSCVDLTYALASRGQELVDRLLDASICPFVRQQGNGWSGSSHIHCVQVGLTDWQGHTTILAGPRMQIMDYVRGLSGLVGHAPIPENCFPPSAVQRAHIQSQYQSWAVGLEVDVYSPENARIPCYCFLERFPGEDQDHARCEVRPFVEFWGGHVVGMGEGVSWVDAHAQPHVLHDADPTMEGNFTRANLAYLVQSAGLKFTYTPAPDVSAAKVQLAYA